MLISILSEQGVTNLYLADFEDIKLLTKKTCIISSGVCELVCFNDFRKHLHYDIDIDLEQSYNFINHCLLNKWPVCVLGTMSTLIITYFCMNYLQIEDYEAQAYVYGIKLS